MRTCFPIVCAFLLVGCQSPQGPHDKTARIADALERRITADEARHILLDVIDREIRAAQTRSATDEDARIVVTGLSRYRQRLSSKFDSFLGRSRPGDELWGYRTFATADHRGGESGFALVRDGRVVEHMGVMIFD
jgi:hypothetical protein